MSDKNKKILIVTTNYRGEDGSDITETGVWLDEFAVPYLVFKDSGYEVTVASPYGGLSPVDENSMSCSNPMEWDDCIKVLRETSRLSEINYKEYDALFLPGGHGPMFDLAQDLLLKEIVEYFYENNKVLSAVCHGPAGFVLAVDKKGESIVKDKKVTSFTNKEEHIMKLDEAVPFLLETKLRELGARFEDATPWTEHVCVDGKLITGQNPQSSLLLAEKVLEVLS
uniref:Dimethylallyltransferase n=1 Tax=uncultured Candidatus Melainabacteria bacterium TaxID=2682970 RepID=A0A650EJ08_9BACT|nr:dimethylallyltransferase [uncultured Candidatus Melainabacteria bacterium]